MNYTEFGFLVFLALAAGSYRLCPERLQSWYLLAASYFFYATWSPRAAVLLAIVTAITFSSGIAIERVRGGWLGPVIAVLLALYLIAFKVALVTPGRGIAGLVMPLGISYYTFKLISYVLEVHWGKMNAFRSVADFAGYVAFFPQIVAGPIQRPADYVAQLPGVPSRFREALPRIAWGCIKKLLIADNLAPAVGYVYAHVTGLEGAPLWLAFYLFPLQLYADFSGLTDIAIGAGKLFGITGPENFNRPFTATSISDYWRRWHISLTTWLADYVFLPLRMATRAGGNFGLAVSITINMVAIGLWHGLSATFLVFGLIHSAYLVVDALTVRARTRFFKRHRAWDAPASWVGCLFTFHLVAIGLVFFRAARVSDGLWLLGHLFHGWGSLVPVLDWAGARNLTIGLIGYLVLELSERYRPDRWFRVRISEAPRWIRWSAWGGATALVLFGIALLLAFSGAAHSPFVYEIF